MNKVCFRKYEFLEGKCLEWHGFYDDNQVGYGMVVHLREVLSDDSVSLICGKSRVISLKVFSIPR